MKNTLEIKVDINLNTTIQNISKVLCSIYPDMPIFDLLSNVSLHFKDHNVVLQFPSEDELNYFILKY